MTLVELDLTEKEIEDLIVVLDCVYDDYDFHGDLTDMKIPVDKLYKILEEKSNEILGRS